MVLTTDSRNALVHRFLIAIIIHSINSDDFRCQSSDADCKKSNYSHPIMHCVINLQRRKQNVLNVFTTFVFTFYGMRILFCFRRKTTGVSIKIKNFVLHLKSVCYQGQKVSMVRYRVWSERKITNCITFSHQMTLTIKPINYYDTHENQRIFNHKFLVIANQKKTESVQINDFCT